jgi:predicted DNA-binding protein YlxM (UPF0122 family)
MIDKVTRMASLYDLYGGLLTDRQRQIIELTYFDDWSLSEIAEHLQVTRQAVHDNLHRAEEQLEHYEALLRVWEHQRRWRDAFADLTEAWHAVRARVPEDERQRMETVMERLRSLLSRQDAP